MASGWATIENVDGPMLGGTRAAASDASRGFLRVHLAHAALFAVLIASQFFFRALPAIADDFGLMAKVFAYLFARNFVFVGVFIAFVALVQARVARGRPRWLSWFGGLVALIALNVAFIFWGPAGPLLEQGVAAPLGLAFENVWTYATFGCLAIWYYESDDRAARAIGALRESELARRSAERWVLEMRLGVRQARLDPRLLFETLDHAGIAYRSGIAAGEELLGDLIDYLRKALPQLRQSAVTLGQELELALAFAQLVRSADGRRTRVEARVDSAVANASFPPMVLQPLCKILVASARPGDSPVQLWIAATRHGEFVRVHLRAKPSLASSDTGLDEVHRTLASMFAPQFRLSGIENVDGEASVWLEIPYAVKNEPLERKPG
jgi:hypothetical protein